MIGNLNLMFIETVWALEVWRPMISLVYSLTSIPPASVDIWRFTFANWASRKLASLSRVAC
jgi:hypothetical protein